MAPFSLSKLLFYGSSATKIIFFTSVWGVLLTQFLISTLMFFNDPTDEVSDPTDEVSYCYSHLPLGSYRAVNYSFMEWHWLSFMSASENGPLRWCSRCLSSVHTRAPCSWPCLCMHYNLDMMWLRKKAVLNLVWHF